MEDDAANRWPLRCLASLYENMFIAVDARSRQRWLILFSLDVIRVYLAVPLLLLISCGDRCARYTDDLREDVVSPAGDKKAVIFRRTCEGDNPLYGSVHLCISSARAAKPSDSDTVFESDGDMTVTARWEDATHLRVVYGRAPSDDGSTVVKQVARFGSIVIDYRNVP
jgi:hypothetical protein